MPRLEVADRTARVLTRQRRIELVLRRSVLIEQRGTELPRLPRLRRDDLLRRIAAGLERLHDAVRIQHAKIAPLVVLFAVQLAVADDDPLRLIVEVIARKREQRVMLLCHIAHLADLVGLEIVPCGGSQPAMEVLYAHVRDVIDRILTADLAVVLVPRDRDRKLVVRITRFREHRRFGEPVRIPSAAQTGRRRARARRRRRRRCGGRTRRGRRFRRRNRRRRRHRHRGNDLFRFRRSGRFRNDRFGRFLTERACEQQHRRQNQNQFFHVSPPRSRANRRSKRSIRPVRSRTAAPCRRQGSNRSVEAAETPRRRPPPACRCTVPAAF